MSDYGDWNDDVTWHYHGGNPRSNEAWQNASQSAHRHRRLIWETLSMLGRYGATSDELELMLDLRHQTCSARLSDMKRDQLVVPSGMTRRTRSGSPADVIILARYMVVEPPNEGHPNGPAAEGHEAVGVGAALGL
jgi:hypothetical protein